MAIGITPRPRRYDKLPQFEFRPIADITSLINQIRRLQVQLCSDAGLIWKGRREGDTRNLCDPWRTIEAKVLNGLHRKMERKEEEELGENKRI